MFGKRRSLLLNSHIARRQASQRRTYGLTAQMRRSAVSVAANIAEGYGRDQTGTFIQFLRISLGSARELDTHVTIAIESV
ncbi:MAG: four helix bundle protein [Hyphomicrobiaceae bacterium]